MPGNMDMDMEMSVCIGCVQSLLLELSKHERANRAFSGTLFTIAESTVFKWVEFLDDLEAKALVEWHIAWIGRLEMGLRVVYLEYILVVSTTVHP